jgi:hypothetical protein
LVQTRVPIEKYPEAKKFDRKQNMIQKAYNLVAGENKPLIDAYKRAIHLESQDCCIYAMPETFVELKWVV